MVVHFSKYQGTGNDFVMLDNRDGAYNALSVEDIQSICHRKTGIGADGLIKINTSSVADFEVDYYNSDGSKSFCGNGARCSVAFAKSLGMIEKSTVFTAIDGVHRAEIDENGIVSIEMLPVSEIIAVNNDFYAHTGSPHYVHFKTQLDDDIVTYGKRIRYSEKYAKEGVNVNFMEELAPGTIAVETYERGVEDETLSCGTGVTACALVYLNTSGATEGNVTIKTKGGILSVRAESQGNGYNNIWLVGPATVVFHGSIYC